MTSFLFIQIIFEKIIVVIIVTMQQKDIRQTPVTRLWWYYMSNMILLYNLKPTHSCSPSIPCAKNWARCWRRAIIQHIRDDVCDNHWHIVWNVLLGMQHRLIEYLLSTYGKRRTRPNKLSDTNRSLARQMKVEKDTESAKFEGGYDKETLVSCGLLIEMRAKW